MRTTLYLLAAPLAWAAAVLGDSTVVFREATTDSSVPVSGKSFSLGEVYNAGYKGGDAPLELLKAHTKYVSSLPPWLRQAVQTNPKMSSMFKSYLQQGDEDDEGFTGTVAATPPAFYDIQYVIPVDIGTPPQRTMLNLDTGSSDLWTFSSDTYQAQVQEQILYRPNVSSTSKRVEGEAWSIRYGDGAGASGIVYKDRVQLGDTFFDEQAVQSAVQVSSAIAEDSFSSGILGMAFGGANTVRPTKQSTYIDNIKDELESPVFTVNLQKGKPGNYNFGYIADEEYTGKIEYTPIVEGTNFWKAPIEGYQVGADGPFREYRWDGVVDTGTTLLLVPDVILEDYYASVPNSRLDPFSGMMVFPCDTILPDFVFGFGEYRGTVPGSYINYTESSSTDCFGGMQSSEGIGMAIIGDVLLKAQFVVFDVGNRTIGFANKETVPAGEPPVAPPPLVML